MYSRHTPRRPTSGAELAAVPESVVSAIELASVTIPTVKGEVQSVKK